jgi:hypothetical protein
VVQALVFGLHFDAVPTSGVTRVVSQFLPIRFQPREVCGYTRFVHRGFVESKFKVKITLGVIGFRLSWPRCVCVYVRSLWAIFDEEKKCFGKVEHFITS